jgi:Lon protease-like protein
MATVMPMFPLGSVLFPGMPLPLHVFEPRYRALVQHCLEGVPEFGVVLIERGSEVGGGDVRTTVGTVARIVEAARFDDGRWAIGAVGVRRVQVAAWLDDEPFPRAEVEDWPDVDEELDPQHVAEATAVFRRVLALAAELGADVVPATVELGDDPAVAVLQMAVAAPLGPSDRQDLLCAEGPAARLALLREHLDDQVELIGAQLAMDGPEPFGEGSGNGPGEDQ